MSREHMLGTTAYLRAELRMARIGLMRVKLLLDQYEGGCAALQAAIMDTERQGRAGKPKALQTREVEQRQASVEAQIRRLLSNTDDKLQNYDAALAQLHADIRQAEGAL